MKSETARLLCVAIGLWLAAGSNTHAEPISTAFTYQGQLRQDGIPVSETCDFWFSLWDAEEDGNQIGPMVAFDGQTTTLPPIAVVDGLFAVELDFGAIVFNGQACWLDIAVACPTGQGITMTMTPRQRLTTAPYAAYALAGPGSGGFWVANGDSIYNTNNGHVGIGTTEPNYPLQVNGDVTHRAIYAGGTLSIAKGYEEPGTGLSVSRTTATSPIRLSLRTEIDGNKIDGFYTLGDASLILNSTSTGNVGIGTSSPQRRLQVGDNTVPDSEGMIRLASRSGTQGSNRIWDIGVPETDADSSGKGYSFVVDDTQSGEDPEFMVKYGSGNVGIGTVEPEAKLDVAGTTRTTGLEVDGGTIRVTGAGTNTGTAAFVHMATLSNGRGCDIHGRYCAGTTINHPMADNDSDAMILVTLRDPDSEFFQITQFTRQPPLMVRYDAELDRWYISGFVFHIGTKFNVMIIKN